MSEEGPTFHLGWVHISDIHFGQGGARDAQLRQAVSDELARDLVQFRERVPRLDHIFVTGDIANSGDTRGGGEYSAAADYLSRLASRIDLGPEAVFTVPGNHDIDRSVARDDDVRRWLVELRTSASIEEALASDAGRERLDARLTNYQTFAADFGSGYDRPSNDAGNNSLWWTSVLESETGYRLRLGGANTALLCQDKDDEKSLQLGISQLQDVLQPDGESDLTVLLTHHPIDWLRDEEDIEPFVRKWSDLHLFGHTHLPWTEQSRRSGQSAITRISAGALYDSNKELEVVGYRYAISAVYTDEAGTWLRHWPRRWSRGNAGFRVDADSVPDGQEYVDHRLAESASNRWHRSPTTSTQSIRTVELDEAISRASSASISRLGSRRTAYPLDMSISELFDREIFVEPRFRDYFDGPPDSSEPSTEVLRSELSSGQASLLLGDPGIGKSVASYAILKALRPDSPGIYLRLRDVREIISDEERKTPLGRLLRASQEASIEGLVLVVDGIDESIAEFDDPRDIVTLLSQLTSFGTIMVTCRRREFEDQLSQVLDDDLFSNVQVVEEWRAAVEFQEFVDRLVEQRFLRDRSILARVEKQESLDRLVRRPLFARMLTFLESSEPSGVQSIDELYAAYLDKLSVSADLALRSSGCDTSVPSLEVWSLAAWEAFSKSLFRDDAFSVSAIVSGVSARTGQEPRCIGRSLGQVTDQQRISGRIRGRFIHYSFFEYLLAHHYAGEIERTIETNDPSRLLDTLILDLTPEVRHFLVGRLRDVPPVELSDTLAETFRLLSVERLRLADRRTTGNLIAYVISRVAGLGGADALARLQESETDPFLRQSLSWALCHVGSDSGVRTFVADLESSAEYRALNRGYLMYYYGDLDRSQDPPYVDDDPATPWRRTLEAKSDFMGAARYSSSVSSQRQAIDLYTLLDYVLVRGQTMDRALTETSVAVLRHLYDAQLPTEVLLSLLGMLSTAAHPASQDLLRAWEQQRLL